MPPSLMLALIHTAVAETYEVHLRVFCEDAANCTWSDDAALREAVAAAYQEINVIYRPAGVSFRPTIEFVYDFDEVLDANEESRTTLAQEAEQHPHRITLHVLEAVDGGFVSVVPSPTGQSQGASAFSAFVGTPAAAALHAHEIGHYLCLAHTHTQLDPIDVVGEPEPRRGRSVGHTRRSGAPRARVEYGPVGGPGERGLRRHGVPGRSRLLRVQLLRQRSRQPQPRRLQPDLPPLRQRRAVSHSLCARHAAPDVVLPAGMRRALGAADRSDRGILRDAATAPRRLPRPQPRPTSPRRHLRHPRRRQRRRRLVRQRGSVPRRPVGPQRRSRRRRAR